MRRIFILERGAMLLPIIMVVLVSSACAVMTATPTAGGSSVEVVFGPGALIFTDTTIGLADLSSYRATLTLSFDGIKDGQVQQWSKTYVMLTGNEILVKQLTIEKTGDTVDPERVFMAEVAGAAYEQRGENACTANAIEDGHSLGDRLEPASFLTGVIGATAAGVETVNGVAADHYTFDQRALGQQGSSESTGELWLAADGGYLVKYVLTTSGNADYFGEGIEGLLTWDYELTDINAGVTIELPEGCPAGMVDAPLLPDAVTLLNVPGVLTYETLSSLPDAVAFYQEQLPGLGWEVLGDPVLTDTMALLEFAQAKQKLTIIFRIGDGGTTVQILPGDLKN